MDLHYVFMLILGYGIAVCLYTLWLIEKEEKSKQKND